MEEHICGIVDGTIRRYRHPKPLDFIDINLVVVTELESEVALFVSEGIGLVDLGILR